MGKQKERKKISNTDNTKITPIVVFIFSISIVLISFVSVIFPVVMTSSFDLLTNIGIPNAGPDKYEIGIWAIPTIISNIIIFSLLIGYRKNKLPNQILKIFKKIFDFELSKKLTAIILIVLITTYVAISASELLQQETWEDYTKVNERIQTWSIEQITQTFEPHVRYFLIKLSEDVFGNQKVIPWIASIALLILTYLITKEITHKRFAGIIAFVILLQSNLFLTYDTSVAYTNFWALFYLLSLYLAYKMWPLSPIVYLISIPAKALTIAFIPMSIFFILRIPITKKIKIIMIMSVLVIIAISGIASISGVDPTSGGEANVEKFNTNEFVAGFASFANQLRHDGLIILFMIPLIVGLFIASRQGVPHADSIMVLISGMLLLAPLLTGFTNQTNQPYRFVPLVIFFAIGVGILLSKISIQGEQTSK